LPLSSHRPSPAEFCDSLNWAILLRTCLDFGVDPDEGISVQQARSAVRVVKGTSPDAGGPSGRKAAA